MSKDEALKLALEALEDLGMKHFESTNEVLYKETFTAIKEALAQPEQLMRDQINYGMSVTQGGKRIDPMSIYKEPEQEPVAWRYKILDYFGRPVWTLKTPKTDIRVFESQPLYTSPPQRKPLTDEEIDELSHSMVRGDKSVNWLCRAIERKHGIYAPMERKGEA